MAKLSGAKNNFVSLCSLFVVLFLYGVQLFATVRGDERRAFVYCLFTPRANIYLECVVKHASKFDQCSAADANK